jgi:hypothetical protein
MSSCSSGSEGRERHPSSGKGFDKRPFRPCGTKKGGFNEMRSNNPRKRPGQKQKG